MGAVFSVPYARLESLAAGPGGRARGGLQPARAHPGREGQDPGRGRARTRMDRAALMLGAEGDGLSTQRPASRPTNGSASRWPTASTRSTSARPPRSPSTPWRRAALSSERPRPRDPAAGSAARPRPSCTAAAAEPAGGPLAALRRRDAERHEQRHRPRTRRAAAAAAADWRAARARHPSAWCAGPVPGRRAGARGPWTRRRDGGRGRGDPCAERRAARPAAGGAGARRSPAAAAVGRGGGRSAGGGLPLGAAGSALAPRPCRPVGTVRRLAAARRGRPPAVAAGPAPRGPRSP